MSAWALMSAVLAWSPSVSATNAPLAGLIGCWRAEGNAEDELGAHPGTPGSGVAFTTGRYGQGFSLDGTENGYVDVSNPVPLLAHTRGTVCLWASVRDTDLNTTRLFGASDRDDTNSAWFIDYRGADSGWGSGRMIQDGSVNDQTILFSQFSPAGSLADTNFHHVAIVCTGGGESDDSEIYIDGVSQSFSYNYQGDYFFSSITDADTIRFGAIARCTGIAAEGQKIIDEVYVYDRPLSAGEVRRVMHADEGPAESIDQLVYREIRRFKVAAGSPRHRAFPGLVRLASGDLLVTYREGSDHWVTDDGIVRMVRSDDGGLTWSDPVTLASMPGYGSGAHHGGLQLRDGRILVPMIALKHLAGGARELRGFLLKSDDDGSTWSDPLPLEPPPEYGWQNCYGRVHERPDGRIWVPGGRGKSLSERPWRSGHFVSFDGGTTFTNWTTVAEGHADETDIGILRDGRLLAMTRTLDSPYPLYRTYSEDDGISWGTPEATSVLGQCPSLLVLPSGTVLLGHRQVDPTRPPGCALSASTDDGLTWEHLADLYIGANLDCSYPSMVLLPDGRIFCVYYTSFAGGNSDIEGVIFEIIEPPSAERGFMMQIN